MGPRDRAIDSISAALGRAGDRALVLTVLGLMSVLAGCSSFSSPSSTGTSPATYQPAAAAAPASDPTASMTPYPSRSLTEMFTDELTTSGRDRVSRSEFIGGCDRRAAAAGHAASAEHLHRQRSSLSNQSERLRRFRRFGCRPAATRSRGCARRYRRVGSWLCQPTTDRHFLQISSRRNHSITWPAKRRRVTASFAFQLFEFDGIHGASTAPSWCRFRPRARGTGSPAR